MTDHDRATPTSSRRRGLAGRVLDEVEQAVVGKRRRADAWCWPAILAKGHVLLEDFPGPRQDAGRPVASPRRWGSTSRGPSSPPTCCPPTSPARSSTTSARGEFEFRRGPLFTGLLLADEINRTPPKTQSALLEAMQERQVTVEGETFPLPEPVPRARDRQPDRVRGHLPAARGPARPVPAAGQLRLPDRATRSTTCCAPARRGSGGGRARPGHRRRRARWRCRRRSRRSRSTRRVGRYCVDLAAATRDHPDVLTGVLAARLAGPGARRPRLRRAAGPRLRHPRGRQGRGPGRCSRTGSRSSPSSG